MDFKSPIAASVARRTPLTGFDVAAFAILIGAFIAIAQGSRGITAPLPPADVVAVSLDYASLPYYALRSTLRMFAALIASFAFTLIYATIAAKSRRAEMVLIPLLDVLQSVPVLGFLSFTVTFFLNLFPGSTLGAECACVFAIFTSQAWNMAFSFYQSLRTVPADLNEVANGFRLTPWQKFWGLEAPFAVPSLLWNAMMSMSGGWFFVVASEAISVGDTTIRLPGIGAYLALAIEHQRLDAVAAAVLAMFVVILAYDQLLFRPAVAWAAKFRVELSAGQETETSWVLRIFQRARGVQRVFAPVANGLSWIAFRPFSRIFPRGAGLAGAPAVSRVIDIVWWLAIALSVVLSLHAIYDYVTTTLTIADFTTALWLTFLTMLRVVAGLVLASLFWVPISVWIGLRPAVAEKAQPVAQLLAAFPANVLFPIAVFAILRYHLNPDIWLSLLIIAGTQWYIVFNVIAGASAFPNDLREAATNFGAKGWHWWRDVILPGIFPYYVTGALTASGGSWNAAIVAEYVRWGHDKVSANGIGAYIAKATEAGDYPRIVLGVAVMSAVVIAFNRLLWRPLVAYGERRLRLD